MGRFVILNILLLGLIGGASAQWQIDRPEYPTQPNIGCTPGRITALSCPVRMECFRDKNFPNGGRCDCNTLWFKMQKKLPFDDSEWDDGFTTSDCEGHHISRFLVAWLCHFGQIVLLMAFLYTDTVVLLELKRVKALRWNAVAYSLVGMAWGAFGTVFVNLIYMLNHMDADKNEFWYLNRGYLFTWFLMPANPIVDFEICVTWIDLYDRTNKMSKSTSRTIKGLRYFLRLMALIMTAGFMLYTISQTPSVFSFLVIALSPTIFGGAATQIGGYLIVKTLCPDKKDVANPNWKVAQAIRRSVLHSSGAKTCEFVALAGMIITSRHAQLGYTYPLFNSLYNFGYCMRIIGWIQYLIYGSRKHLKRFANENSSAYFGFSTIGLNKTLTTASSKISAASSVISTRSSAPPAEKD